MDTLIEFYDERAIENVLGPEVIKPKRVVYLCPREVYENKQAHEVLRKFFARRGLGFKLVFVESSVYKADRICQQLEEISNKYRDLALDVTGGNDAALFAAGMFCKEHDAAAFTYSRRKNKFYNIANAPFADQLEVDISYSVEDFFRMTGGSMRKGRVDNKTLPSFSEDFIPFFKVFMKYRKKWPDEITFFQRISQNNKEGVHKLHVQGLMEQKGERGRRVCCNRDLMQDLSQIGFLRNLKYHGDDEVAFDFRDENTRSWLRDVGSALELYMYKQCCDTNGFYDVVSSAIVDWDGYVGHDSVSNEIDVVATCGIKPLFISCKACDVKTEAINELSILKERFGGKGAKAMIVTTERCNAAARHRAQQLGIAVVDLEELEEGKALERIKILMKMR